MRLWKLQVQRQLSAQAPDAACAVTRVVVLTAQSRGQRCLSPALTGAEVPAGLRDFQSSGGFSRIGNICWAELQMRLWRGALKLGEGCIERVSFFWLLL